jgi:IclR family transcriptional regulator, pca regulon regulatory protein
LLRRNESFTMRDRVPQSETGRRRRYELKTLYRGLEVLNCFTPPTSRLTLQEVGHRLHWPKSTAYRFVAALVEMGYLIQDPSTRQYRLSIKLLDLGFGCLQGLGIPTIALPYLEELAQQCQESSSMSVLDGSDVLYVARAATRRWMSVTLQVGSRLPAYCTSMGKVLLAALPWSEVQQRLGGVQLVKCTPKTIVSLDLLKRELARVREQGYAINDEELEIGLRSAAAPVYGAAHAVFAAVNISTSSSRVSRAALVTQFVPRLLRTSRAISDLRLPTFGFGSPFTDARLARATVEGS